MEAMDRLRARDSQRLTEDVLKPVEIRSLNDIKYVVGTLDPSKNPVSPEVPLSTTIQAATENGTRQIQVSARTRSKSRREYLLEGFNSIKRWMESEEQIRATSVSTEVNGVEMRPATIGSGGKGKTWVDQLINQWLGGYREGLFIYWDLGDGFLYKYDLYAHKLTRMRKNEQSQGETTTT